MPRLAPLLLAAALASAAVPAAASPAIQGDAARGQRLFLQCRACHTVAQGEASTVGPNLWGVVGAKAGTQAGYHYSAALAASELRWTPDKLDAWLTRPTALAPGTTMAFAGVAAPDARRDIIAYLATLGGGAGR